MSDYIIAPNCDMPGLTKKQKGLDHLGNAISLEVITERPITLFLNRQEIVTNMTIGDYPEYLALGYLLNQNMLKKTDVITGIDYDDEEGIVVVRTQRETDYEEKLQKKVRTSGCAQGTVFGDIMEDFEQISLSGDVKLSVSHLYELTRKINQTDSLYLKAGAIHGCVLCHGDAPLVYMEDVGRHNAVDKIAGYLFRHQMSARDKILYTTGRLTSEMVIKTARMEIPVLVSRSGFTAWGVELARQVGLTLIGRARGKRFMVLSGAERLIYNNQILDSEAVAQTKTDQE